MQKRRLALLEEVKIRTGGAAFFNIALLPKSGLRAWALGKLLGMITALCSDYRIFARVEPDSNFIYNYRLEEII
jgi:hypothetical protein